MSCLSHASAPPAPGEVTRCESQCTWVQCAEDQLQTEQAGGPADITIEVGEEPLFEHCSEALFLPTGDVDITKKSFNALYYSGALAALETVAEHKVAGESPWPAKCSQLLLGALRSVSALHSSFYPHLLLSGEELLAQFSLAAQWTQSPVRALQWHPHDARLAIARRDNLVQVYQMQSSVMSSMSSFQSGRMQQLKHSQQKRISSLAWRPYSGSVLAVGCQTGVLVWQVRSHPGAARPHAQFLSSSGHSPVTSVAWSGDGRLLASASPADASFMLWDVSRPDNSGTPICRHGGGGVSLLAWSPVVPESGVSRLMTATPSPLFRVWETKGFTCERWSNLAGRVTAACWSPDGSVLLFAMQGDPALYYLTFFAGRTVTSESAGKVGGADNAVKCVDLSVQDMPAANDPNTTVQVGGCVQSMAWDRTGERLAVVFTADSLGHELVAVFNTQVQPIVDVLPSGFVRGRAGETPELVSFQNDADNGSLLSVAWSSGRVGFIPLLYSNPNRASHPAPPAVDMGASSITAETAAQTPSRPVPGTSAISQPLKSALKHMDGFPPASPIPAAIRTPHLLSDSFSSSSR